MNTIELVLPSAHPIPQHKPQLYRYSRVARVARHTPTEQSITAAVGGVTPTMFGIDVVA